MAWYKAKRWRSARIGYTFSTVLIYELKIFLGLIIIPKTVKRFKSSLKALLKPLTKHFI